MGGSVFYVLGFLQAPLGLLELASGFLLWRQLFLGSRSLDVDWKTGGSSVLMTVMTVIWMLSPEILYTPYLDVLCRWNISLLQDQRWAGFVMLLAGAPLQLASLWLVLGLEPPSCAKQLS